MNGIYQLIQISKFDNYDLDDSFLCEHDKDRLFKMSNNRKRFEFLLGRNLTKKLLEKFTEKDWSELPLQFNTYDKPLLPMEDLHFNLSHSGDYIIGCVSDLNCGVDIQKKEQLIKPEKLWDRIAHPKEQKNIPHHTIHDIIRLWTKKESLTKTLGGGFSHSFFKIDFSDWDRKSLFTFDGKSFKILKLEVKDPQHDYYCYLTAETDNETFQWNEVKAFEN